MMQNFRRKIILCFLLCAIAFLAIIVRVFYIASPGTLNLPQWRSQNKPAIRGSILDRNGSPLALTIPSQSVFARPERFHPQDAEIDFLSECLGIDKNELAQRVKRGTKNFAWLSRQIAPDVGAQIREAKIAGVETVPEPTRVYPYGELAGQLLGFCGVDHTGLSGLERSLDARLLPPKGGTEGIRNIVLTIDRYMQYIAEDELAIVAEESGAKHAVCLIMQPQTGEMLTIASWPSFDPNNFDRYSQERYLIPAVSNIYEPGSTFKIFSPAWLIENQRVRQDEYFLCTGRIGLHAHTVECILVHGSLRLQDILAQSCNVGMIKLSARLNADEFHGWLERFGFGLPTGIGLPGEASGILRSAANWSGLSRGMVSIGYEISVTPLQLIRAAASLASEGLLMQPLLVKAITDHEGRILEASSPAVVRRVMRPATARTLLAMLRRAVTEGTARTAALPDIDVGGKTGTAHIAREDGSGYSPTRYTASFIGYLPYQQSNLVILIIIQEPKIGEHMGGTLAAPVFRRIARRTMIYLHEKIPPVIDEESMQICITSEKIPEAERARARRIIRDTYRYDPARKHFILLDELADHQKTELSLILQNIGILN
ncbi:MAG: penicillin-binding protein 2 [Spirochaetota bacterium]|jgi:cell division protein FtsI/penicillin-binding protein 2|nr:penicillin-binding protein 2 [Spirochaetota bacterium]